MSITTVKWSVVEYHRLVALGILENKSVELLQGEIVEMAPEGPRHSNRIRQTANEIRRQLPENYEVSEAHPITLDDSEPEPDIAIIRAGDYEDRHPQAEDILLIIEFAQSSLSKDLEEKRRVYAQAGITEYWVVDLSQRQIFVFRHPLNRDYQSRLIVTEGILTTPVFSQMAIAAPTLLGKS